MIVPYTKVLNSIEEESKFQNFIELLLSGGLVGTSAYLIAKLVKDINSPGTTTTTTTTTTLEPPLTTKRLFLGQVMTRNLSV